jgi:pyruvate dehydrogenase E2 component (dihydrolipoamide acetyltransferase)
MPEVAANATHATLVCWNKQVGDHLEAGESIADVETDKAILELPVYQGGVIGKLLVEPGTEVLVGDPIAILYVEGESFIGKEDEAILELPVPPVILTPTEPIGQLPPDRRIFSSPVARRLALQNQINLAHVAGSGPQGRITKHDVVQHIEQLGAKAPSESSPVIPVTPISKTLAALEQIPARLVAPSATRRTIAKRLSQSKSEVPHFYLRADCQVDALVVAREHLNEHRVQKISINDFVIRAAAIALEQVPQVNVSWRHEGVLEFLRVDISVAVDTPTGLLTPIVRDAARKTLSAISAEMRGLAFEAREGKLRLDQFYGGTFSVTNLGMFGVDDFDAIINQPQAAILAVGAVRTIPVVRDEVVATGQVMSVVLSVDHRVVDGATAARWLAAFRALIERPYKMLA